MASLPGNTVQRCIYFAVVVIAVVASAQASTYTIAVGDGTLTYQENVSFGSCPFSAGGQMGQITSYSYVNFSYATSSLNEALTGGATYLAAPSSPFCPATGWRGPNPIVLQGSGYVIQFYPGAPYSLGGSATIQLQGSQGFINPKYFILGVTYAPPGSSSNVTYTNSTFVGSTIATTDSFLNDVNLSVSVTGAIKGWGAGGKVGGTASSDFTQGSNSSLTTTLSKQTSVSYKTNGTGNAFAPVNHDYDTIWLWLNPLLIFTANPNSPKNVVWNGYGYDNQDVNGMDIFPVQVGWLNGHFGVNPSIQTVLARGWVTANEPGMLWPSGEGPGLTSADIKNILQADPFTDPDTTYVLPSPLPATSADGRFTQIPFPPNPLPYTQAGPGNGGGITTSYNLVNTDTSTLGRGTSHTFKQAFGVEQEFTVGFFGASLTSDFKETNTLTWSQTWQNTLTHTQTLTDALSVTGPGCAQTSPPCVPVYSGPGEFIVFQDNLYGTFMFYPSH